MASGPNKHPYSVRGQSPRQIVEAILSAADDGRSMTESVEDEGVRGVLVVDAVLSQMREMGVGFCDIDKVER